MICLTEGALEFSFDGPNAFEYDDSDFYRKQFDRLQYTKGVDFVYVTKDAAWLIEVKDYRMATEADPELRDKLVQQVRDTLAGLAAANANTNRDDDSRNIAAMALSRRRWRVAFHLEGLDRFGAELRSNLQIELGNRLKSIDRRVVITSNDFQIGIPWKVSGIKNAE